jgi:hypothetical protein
MINKINPDSTSFQAKLYSTKGKLIRSTDFFKPFGDNMSAKGSPKTDIFVRAINSKKSFDNYEISADLTIKNPLLGTQSFNQLIDRQYISPCEDEIDELHFIDRLVGLESDDCKRLENRALCMQILEKININSEKLGFNLDDFIPSKVLEKMLIETPQEEHGFVEKRIEDFKKIAKRLDESLIKDKKLNGWEWCV